MLRRGWLLMTLALCLGGCGGTPMARATATVPAIGVAVGQPFTLYATASDVAFDATIEQLREEASVTPASGTPVAARGRFVILTLALVNAGTVAATPCGSFRLRDNRGRVFDGDAAATAALTPATGPLRALCTTLRPGQPYDIVAAFDVPADAAGFGIIPAKR